jgi:hypothetical protein
MTDNVVHLRDYEPKRDKCTYADWYQAKRKPTCGCRVCADKWARREPSDEEIDAYLGRTSSPAHPAEPKGVA